VIILPVTAGPAVSMAWNHHSHSSLGLAEYESSRGPTRTSPEFQMPSTVRRKYLQQSGVSLEEIKEAQMEIRRTKRNRRATFALQEFEGTQILLESIGRKWRRARSKRSQQHELDDLWKNANRSNTDKKKSAAESKKKSVEDPSADRTEATLQDETEESEC